MSWVLNFNWTVEYSWQLMIDNYFYYASLSVQLGNISNCYQTRLRSAFIHSIQFAMQMIWVLRLHGYLAPLLQYCTFNAMTAVCILIKLNARVARIFSRCLHFLLFGGLNSLLVVCVYPSELTYKFVKKLNKINNEHDAIRMSHEKTITFSLIFSLLVVITRRVCLSHFFSAISRSEKMSLLHRNCW